MGPRLSVITPTFNRRARLGRVLSALTGQSLGPQVFEVVVVDDGSTDGTSEWLAAQHFPFQLVTKRQENAGPAVARNTGVLAASGELVVFLDDDVVPEPRLLEEHLQSHEREQQDLAVIGPLGSLPHYDLPWVAWEQAKVEEQYSAMSRGEFAPTFRQFWTGNASVARHQLVDAGLFNPAFLRAEDVELGLRLHQRGVAFRFNADAMGYHHAERSLASWVNAQTSYGRLEVQILDKLGEDATLSILAGNLARLRPEVRWLSQQCATHAMRHTAVTKTLMRVLETRGAAQWQSASLPVCSVLANLLYWRASCQALGPERFTAVLRGSEARLA